MLNWLVCWLGGLDSRIFAALPIAERRRLSAVAAAAATALLLYFFAGYEYSRESAGTAVSATVGLIVAGMICCLYRLSLVNLGLPLFMAGPDRPSHLPPPARGRDRFVRFIPFAILSVVAAAPASAWLLETRLVAKESEVLRTQRQRASNEILTSAQPFFVATEDAIGRAEVELDALERGVAAMGSGPDTKGFDSRKRERIAATAERLRNERIASLDEARSRLSPVLKRLRGRLESMRVASQSQMAILERDGQFDPSRMRRIRLMFEQTVIGYPVTLAVVMVLLSPVLLRSGRGYSYDRINAAQSYISVVQDYARFLPEYARGLAKYTGAFSFPHRGYDDAPFDTAPQSITYSPAATMFGSAGTGDQSDGRSE